MGVCVGGGDTMILRRGTDSQLSTSFPGGTLKVLLKQQLC